MKGMIKKIIISVMVVIILIAAVFTRNSFVDTYVAEKEEFFVPYYSEQIIGMLGNVEKKLLKSKVIFVGKATGNSKFVYRNFIQEVQVIKNISGIKGIKAGDKIWLTGYGGSRDIENIKKVKQMDKAAINVSFMNYMQKGDEYLIFAKKKLADDLSLGKRVYILNDDVITMMYLNLTNDKSYVCKNYISGEGIPTYVRYKEVKNSEFYSNSQKVLDKMQKIKHRIIKKVLFIPMEY